MVATGEGYADALAASPLAGAEDAPLLLAGSEQLPETTAQEIDRLGSDRVIVVGGTAAVSATVESQLRSLDGVEVVDRAGGSDRFATAETVASMVTDDPATATAEAEVATDGGVYMVSGTDFPDAVTVSGLAAEEHAPIVLATEGQLPQATRDYLDTHREDIDRVTVIGGQSAVNSAVEGAAASAADARTERLAGSTRFDTSVRVAEHAIEQHGDMEEVFVATGADYPDALTAGSAATASDRNAVISLVHGAEPASAATWENFYEHYKTDRFRQVTFVGGNTALEDDVKDQYSATVNLPTDNPTSAN